MLYLIVGEEKYLVKRLVDTTLNNDPKFNVDLSIILELDFSLFTNVVNNFKKVEEFSLVDENNIELIKYPSKDATILRSFDSNPADGVQYVVQVRLLYLI